LFALKWKIKLSFPVKFSVA